MRFSHAEKKDLAFAGFMISLAFGILLAGGFNAIFNPSVGLLFSFIIAFFTAGIGFLLHELMHKFTAQRYGLWAEFRAFYNMLWLALLFSLFGFIIAAPGAVFMRGYMTRDRNGKVSLAGPMTNIVLAVLFLFLLLIVGGRQGILGEIFGIGLTINSLLAAFNMIPAMPFDGAKVLAWDKAVYGATTAVAVGLFAVSFFV